MALKLFQTLYHHHSPDPILPVARSSIYSLRALHIFALGLRRALVDLTGASCSPAERTACLSVTNKQELARAERFKGHLVMGFRVANADGSEKTVNHRRARSDQERRVATMEYKEWVRTRPARELRQLVTAKRKLRSYAIRVPTMFGLYTNNKRQTMRIILCPSTSRPRLRPIPQVCLDFF